MKTLSIASIVLLLFLFTVHSSFAATSAVLSPGTVSTAPGKTFKINIAVDPNGTPNYAEKIVLNYPADILKVDSFVFSAGWTPLTQSGYDSTDSINGELIKTAGYASGITSRTVFGTVTFSVKKAGNGSITLGSGSQAFEKEDQKPISGNSVAVASAAPAAVQSAPSVPAAAPVPAAERTYREEETVEPEVETENPPSPVFVAEEEAKPLEAVREETPPIVLEGQSAEPEQPDQTPLMWFFVISITILINACCLIFWTLKMRK